MDDFSNIWIEQCEAAREIRDAWGTRTALGYLVGEKLLNYVHAADSDPSWEAHLPEFAAEIRRIFTNDELRAYFATTTRVGVAGHVCTDEQHETMCDAGAFDEDAVTGATDAILLARTGSSARRHSIGRRAMRRLGPDLDRVRNRVEKFMPSWDWLAR